MWTTLPMAAALAALVVNSSAKLFESQQLTAEMYESGEVHNALMARKMATWQRTAELGLMDSRIYSSYAVEAAPVPCVNGKATVIPGDKNNTFRCNNFDFYDFKSHADLGSKAGEGSSSWGWTSPEGREFVAIGQSDGTAFAEILSSGKLQYLGRLPQYSVKSIWREIRGYKSYVVIVSEAKKHGVQIFDMAKLLTVDPSRPVVFSNDKDLTAHWDELPNGSTHNIVVNEEKQYAVAVGAQPRNSTCRSGLIFIDLSDVTKPTSPGCAAGDGYVHDAQCLVYRGPDTKYYGRDICYGYNEDTLTIYDVTLKNVTNIISRTTYKGASYTHQGWVTNTTWQEWLLLDDELDEEKGQGVAANGRPTTYLWNIKSLEKPVLTGYYQAPTQGIDHNQYVVGSLTFQSNYGGGLRVLDISSLPSDPTGAGVKEVGFFDVYPEDDAVSGGGVIDFVGTWSHYPYFKSGFVMINTIERGAFVVKRTF